VLGCPEAAAADDNGVSIIIHIDVR